MIFKFALINKTQKVVENSFNWFRMLVKKRIGIFKRLDRRQKPYFLCLMQL